MGGVLQRTHEKKSTVRWLERTSKESSPAPKRSHREVSTSDESEISDELERESETVETTDEEPGINVKQPPGG